MESLTAQKIAQTGFAETQNYSQNHQNKTAQDFEFWESEYETYAQKRVRAAKFAGETILKNGDEFARDIITELFETCKSTMYSTFSYEISGDDFLTDRGQSLREVVKKGRDKMAVEVLKNPDSQFQLDRENAYLHQLDEYLKMADGDVLVRFSPIPDKVLSGAVEMDQYDKERKKMLCYVGQKVGSQIFETSISLDLSDKVALREVFQTVFGVNLPANFDSEYLTKLPILISAEEILRLAEISKIARARQNPDGFRLPADTPIRSQMIADAILNSYDANLERRFSGEFYAGRNKDSAVNSRDKVLSFPAEIAQLIEEIRANPKKRKELLYAQAAWLMDQKIDYSAEKKPLIFSDETARAEYVAARESAGASAKAAGIEFKNDCPTSISANLDAQISAIQNDKTLSEAEKEYAIEKLKNSLEKTEKIEFKKGNHCIIEFCPNNIPDEKGKIKEFDVGPCEICKNCQGIFDAKKTDDSREVANANKPIYDAKMASLKKSREKMAEKQGKFRKFGAKVLNNIRRFIWGDGIFAGVEKVEFYSGEICENQKLSKEIYREKYDLAT